MSIKKYVSLDRLTEYDALIKQEIVESVSTKADASHTHITSDITDLREATQSSSGLLSASDKIQLDMGGIPIVTTSGDGVTYTATVDGMTLTTGASFIMIPHTVSTTTAPKLNVNNLGAKNIRRRLSSATTSTTQGYNASWLSANKPILVTYDGTFWIADLPKPSAADISGTMAVSNGGIGKSSVTAGSFLVGNGTSAMVEKTPDEALTALGLTATATELNYCDGVTSNIQTQLDAKTDTKVTQTSISSTDMSSAGHYPILLAYSKSPVSGTSSTTNYNSKFTANPYTGQIVTPMLASDDITTNHIEITTDDGSGKLLFRTSSDSKIVGTTPSGSECEMMRMGGDTSTPLLIIGDGLYVNKIGNTNISAGKAVQIITPNERVILENVGSSTYSGYFRPNTNGTCALGTTGNRWKQLFAATTSISTSDEREKNNITAIADYPSMFSDGNVFEILFSRLVPKTFYLNLEDNAPELHIGFVAQDIVSVFEELGISEDDIAFLHHGYWIDEETGEEKDAYGLRYEEFIALNTYMIQKLIAEKEVIKSRLDRIEEALGISSNE